MSRVRFGCWYVFGFGLVAVFLVSVSGYVCAQAAPKQVIVTVDDVDITKDDLYTAIVQSYSQQAQETLNRLVNEILVSKEATKRNVKVTDAEIKKKADELGVTGELSQPIKKMIETSILAEKMIVKEKKVEVNKAEIKKFFDENKTQLGEQEQIHIRQIFILSETEANDILIAINSGADFAKMVAAKSQDTVSRDKGGDLGFFARGMLSPEIEKVVFNMKAGEVSPVIKTTAGFHIIRAEEKKEAKEAKFDTNMEKRLKKLLFNKKIQSLLPEWLNELRKNAVIKNY